MILVWRWLQFEIRLAWLILTALTQADWRMFFRLSDEGNPALLFQRFFDNRGPPRQLAYVRLVDYPARRP